MMLSVKDLEYSYPSSGKIALRSVSFDVGASEYVAVLGANGSGKSTLARCIVGLLAADSGLIHIDAPVFAVSAQVPSALVFQSPSDQIIAETVELDAAFGPENLGLDREEMRRRVRASLDAFSLTPLASEPTHSLTSGQKQHLALAGVAALKPSLLVLDEPTSMLSEKARASVLSYLDRYHGEGGTVFHITHDLSEASRAQRVLVLDDGQLVFNGAPDALFSVSSSELEKWGLRGAADNTFLAMGKKTLKNDERNFDFSPVLECEGISIGPLKNFSLKLARGTITAIIGESGSGKSVLLEILSFLRVASSGFVRYAEGESSALAVQESEASLFAEFVADDVGFGPQNKGVVGEALVTRVTDAMNLTGLPFETFADRRTFSLSGGERRKAALAGIVAMDASIIFLDEPSSSLDTRSRSNLMNLLRGLKAEGKTVVFTTGRSEECAIADIVIELPPPENPGQSAWDMEKNESDSPDPKSLTRDQLALEKLRKGAMGAYRNIDTPIHRLPPLGKFILVISCITAALSILVWKWLAAVIVLECVPLLVSRYPLKKMIIGILKILPWLVFICVLQYFFAPGTMAYFVFILRFIALYIPLCLFTFVTAPTEILYGMEDFLFPLRIARFPVRDASLVTGIVFRFISLLYGEAARITSARIIRGAGARRKKGLFGAVSSMASLFVPLVLRTLTRAERLAQAITARYYGNGKSSRYVQRKITAGQVLLSLIFPALAGALIFLSFYFGSNA